jgi:hypothetical protein
MRYSARVRHSHAHVALLAQLPPTIPYTYPTLRQSRRKMCVDI